VRPATQLIGFVAVCCWALATRLLWAPSLALDRDAVA
jgi:hypothetical protein